jgi:hypothetical protein
MSRCIAVFAIQRRIFMTDYAPDEADKAQESQHHSRQAIDAQR